MAKFLTTSLLLIATVFASLSHSFAALPSKGYGFTLGGGSSDKIIMMVFEGSAAAKAGLKRQDYIERVNGQSTANLNNLQVLEIFRKSLEVHVVILRNGATIHLKIKAEPLIIPENYRQVIW